LAFAAGLLVAAALWGVDVQAFIWPPSAEHIIWIPVAALWLEIGAIIAALFVRYVNGRSAVGLGPIVVAWTAATVHFAFVWVLLPGILFAP